MSVQHSVVKRCRVTRQPVRPSPSPRLAPRTKLVLGPIAQTLPRFVSERPAEVGFVAVDVDLYSSTRDVLALFGTQEHHMLRRVFMYVDDIDFVFNHRFAGSWLAIDEYNREHDRVKIDVWHGLRKGRVFDRANWIDKMFVVHDLDDIERVVLDRQASTDCALS